MQTVLETLDTELDLSEINEKSMVFALEERKHAVFFNVTWETYEDLLEMFPRRRNPKLWYDRGVLEVMPLPEHEIPIFAVYSLVELFAVEMKLDSHCIGAVSTLKRRDLKHGIEPDCAFYFGEKAALMRDKNRIDLKENPAPDLAIEIDVTHGSLDKLDLYAELGISEIWLFEGDDLRILCLENGRYVEKHSSQIFPNVSAQVITDFSLDNRRIMHFEWHDKVKRWARENLKK